MLVQTAPTDKGPNAVSEGPQQQNNTCKDGFTHMLDYAPAPGWTVHVAKTGRLYYCNHLTRVASWLPPVEAWKNGNTEEDDGLPYGWERALDESGRSYFINHVSKTTSYESPAIRYTDNITLPEPRLVVLEKSPALGFGFVAGSEKPVVVRFVTEGGPSVEKLLPGDQILAVNGEDVASAPREHVISLVRACESHVELLVCQPAQQNGTRKSTLLSASKRARLRNKPCRVRFAESVCINEPPLFPTSAFSLDELRVMPTANVLKVFLENGQTKSFKYDAWTTVNDVLNSIASKLNFKATEHFSLVVEHIKSARRNKLTLLDPAETLVKIASRPGVYKLRCLFRIAFVPLSPAILAQSDLNAFDYLFTQCCNDVVQERFAPELQYEAALKLAALHIYQHALVNNISINKLTVKTVEKKFGLDKFVPISLLENVKRKELCKLIAHFLKLHSTLTEPDKQLTPLQAKLLYLNIINQLPSYGAKCFSAGQHRDAKERVILVSPKFGISQIAESRNSVTVPIANIEDLHSIDVKADDEVTQSVIIHLKNERTISILVEEHDAFELILVLKGYFRIMTGHILPVNQHKGVSVKESAPPYYSQHKVVPEKWSYINQNSVKMASFTSQPLYQPINRKTNGLYNTVGRQTKPPMILGSSFDSNMNKSYSNKNHPTVFGFNSSYDSNDYKNNLTMKLQNISDRIKNDSLAMRQDIKLRTFMTEPEEFTEQDKHRHSINLTEWRKGSLEDESDYEGHSADEEPGKLKHSDSLLLLNKIGCNAQTQEKISVNNALKPLRNKYLQQTSESDSDSILTTPTNSPKPKEKEMIGNRISFGLRSPDTPSVPSMLTYLKRLQSNSLDLKGNKDKETNSEGYVCNEDLIDLTHLLPPVISNKIDCALSEPINKPPLSFADSVEKLDALCFTPDGADQNLEEFLARVIVPSPSVKATPAKELTPEEIMAYIIPPPPLEKD